MGFFSRRAHTRPIRIEDSLDEVVRRQHVTILWIADIEERMGYIMATSKEARDAVFALGGKIDAVIAKFGEEGAIPADVQADIDAIEVEAKAQGGKMDAAVADEPIEEVVDEEPVIVDEPVDEEPVAEEPVNEDPIFNPSTF